MYSKNPFGYKLQWLLWVGAEVNPSFCLGIYHFFKFIFLQTFLSIYLSPASEINRAVINQNSRFFLCFPHSLNFFIAQGIYWNYKNIFLRRLRIFRPTLLRLNDEFFRRNRLKRRRVSAWAYFCYINYCS